MSEQDVPIIYPTFQDLHDCGLNPFAIQLVTESPLCRTLVTECSDLVFRFVVEGILFTIQRAPEHSAPSDAT